MKKLISVLALFAGLYTARADMNVFTITNGTPTLLLSGAKIVDNIVVLNSSTNTATVRFYDSSTADTNVVRAAYTRYTTISTNFDSVFTNTAGVLVTNTFAGVYKAPVAVSAVTNARPVIQAIAVPASTTASKDTHIQTIRGLILLSDQDVVVTVDYRNQP